MVFEQYYQCSQLGVIFITCLVSLFNLQLQNTTSTVQMPIAPIIKPLTKMGFLLQYYLLILFVWVRNVFYTIKGHPKARENGFSIHPMKKVHPLVFAHTHELIKHDGFTFEVHEQQTQDGAVVSLWRIRSEEVQKWNDANPVLIQHGLLDCSMSWFLHEQKQKSLPFVLAQQGYDVWVGNNRGTVYSDTNSHLPHYWQFNVDHFAQYDQPALINKVLKESQKQQLIYIGHSQGSTQFILGQSYNPELQLKIEKFIGMGTVISLGNLKNHGLLKIVSKFYLVQILQHLGFKTILNLPRWMNRKVGVLVHHYAFYSDIIMNFIQFLCGKTQKNNLDVKRLGILVSHQPGGTSIQSVKHWIQAYRHGKFRKYDYGKNKNKIVYGSQVPPEYTFDHVKQLPFKTYIFRGQKDAVISDTDFATLINHFDSSNLEVHTIKDYAHLDYAWSVSAKQNIYDKIVDILREQKLSSQLSSENIDTEDTSFEGSTGQIFDFDY